MTDQQIVAFLTHLPEFCLKFNDTEDPRIVADLHSLSKNEPTLTSCSFIKHGLTLIILGKQHQHIPKILHAYLTFLVPSFLLTLFAFKYL